MSEEVKLPKAARARVCKHKQGETWDEPGCCGDDDGANQNQVSDSSEKSVEN